MPDRKQFNIRCNDGEMSLWRKAARKLGMTTSEFARLAMTRLASDMAE